MHIVSFNGTNLHWALNYICEDLNKSIRLTKPFYDIEELRIECNYLAFVYILFDEFIQNLLYFDIMKFVISRTMAINLIS